MSGANTQIDTSTASFFAWMGCASALVFANLGAAYGTAKGGVGLCSMGVMSPGLVMKNIIGVVMAGVLGIYGLIVAVIISGQGKCTPLLKRRGRLPQNNPLPTRVLVLYLLDSRCLFLSVPREGATRLQFPFG